MEILVSENRYITSDGIEFAVKIFHQKYARKNRYELYKEDKICADGAVPRTYTTRDIFNYWVRDEGTIMTFKEVM